jgi:hypothetical protein
MVFICVMTLESGAFAGAPQTPETLPPQKALLVLTREGWGCFGGQEIRGDVASLLNGAGAGVRWEEIKNPEDRQDRLELYLYFPAGPVSGLPGYLVLKLGVDSTDPEKPGEVRLQKAALRRDAQEPVFELQGAVRGDLAADLLYARDFHLHQGLFACPEASLFEPRDLHFLKAYAVKTGLKVVMPKPGAQEGGISIPLTGFWLKQTREVAAGAELLDLLEQKFKVDDKSTFLWDKARVTSQALAGLASAWEQGKVLKSHIALILRDRQGTREIRRSPIPFNPHLRQKITLKDPRGQVTGGEVWIGLDLLR